MGTGRPLRSRRNRPGRLPALGGQVATRPALLDEVEAWIAAGGLYPPRKGEAMARLSSKLPQGDGLSAMDTAIVADPKRLRVVVALVDCARWVHDADAGTDVPLMRVRRVEVISDSTDAEQMLALLRREYERRTGQLVLPLDLETEIRDALKQAQQPDETGEAP